MSRIDESRSFVPVRIAVMTVSDTRKCAMTNPAIRWLIGLEKAGHRLADRAMRKDDISAIQAKVTEWSKTRD